MIAIVIGTTAELIKMAPVYQELASRDLKPEIWWTGMHNHEVEQNFNKFEIDFPVVHLGGRPNRDVNSSKEAVAWFVQVTFNGFRRRKELRQRLRTGGESIVLVHGDTFTTLIGSGLSRIWKSTTMHVEAGYRSGSLRSPFPEEFNRRMAAKFSDVHFAPGLEQASNLSSSKGEVVNTLANTALDALRLVLQNPPAAEFSGIEDFGIVTLHRFEYLSNDDLVVSTVNKIKEISSKIKIYYFVGTHDKKRLADLGLLSSIPSTLEIRDKLEYSEFIPIVNLAKVIITDSGGLQQEATYLGIPTLIHRERTEHKSGLGVTAILSGYDVSKFDSFIDDISRLKGSNSVSKFFPSKAIASYIEEFVTR